MFFPGRTGRENGDYDKGNRARDRIGSILCQCACEAGSFCGRNFGAVFPGTFEKIGIKRLNCAQTKPEHRKQERMSVMRRKRTGGKNSAYRREKAIMTASVVLVLAAMTVTGISVYRNHQKSQEEEQHSTAVWKRCATMAALLPAP